MCIPMRVTLAIMGLLGIVTAYTNRICLSMAIVEIVVKKNHTKKAGSGPVCEEFSFDLRANDPTIERYTWPEELQGRILSSFYIGYIITHLPGGMLADKFGGKWTLSIGVLISAFCSLFTPYTIIHGGPMPLILLRIMMGLGQGTIYPALTNLLAKWVPAKERGKLGTLVLGGGQIGIIVANSVSGVLIATYDWQSVFYVFGWASVVWFIVFSFLCFSSPATHPWISAREKEYLEREVDQSSKIVPPTPWKAIMTNVVVWALISGQVGHDWGLFTVMTDLPKYMADVMRFPIKTNGYLTSLPYLLMWIISMVSGYLSDWMIREDIMTTTNVRKLMTALAAFIPGTALVLASYAGCDHVLVVIYFTVGMGFMGTFFCGMKLSPLDISSNYAGTLTAITNGLGAITGVAAPYLVGILTPNATLMEWRLVFWISFFVLFSTTIVYCIWNVAEMQPFNDPETLKAYQEAKAKAKAKD